MYERKSEITQAKEIAYPKAWREALWRQGKELLPSNRLFRSTGCVTFYVPVFYLGRSSFLFEGYLGEGHI